MGAGDGAILGATKIVDHGPDSQRWTMVVVSDGYRSTEMTQFQTDAQNFVNTLLATAPFDAVQAAINVYRLDVTSTDSGADDPAACGGSGATARTFFDASFCTSGIRRLLVVDNAAVMTAATNNVPGWDAVLVIVNSTVYGGSGGAIGVFSMAAGAIEIGIHELGHTAFGLADEYEYWAGCGSGETGRDNHPAVEPAQPNVTINSNRATIKWADLIAATTPMPTTTNANCAACDPQPNPFAADTVGAYEGAHYYHCDAYRPQFNCRMRNLGEPFCAVCRRRITQTLTPFLPAKSFFKDFKDAKPEKLEKIEKSEFKDRKSEKLEIKESKLEIKERKPEIKEVKLEKSEKLEIGEFEKRLGEEVKFDERKFDDTKFGEVFDPQLESGVRERVTRLEGEIQRLSHFITREQRPSLERGALANEGGQPGPAPDADDAGSRPAPRGRRTGSRKRSTGGGGR